MRRFFLLLCVLMFLFLPAGRGLAKTANGSLCYGDEGEEVRKLQQALKDLGYSIGTVDGHFGAYTENAVRKFQRRNHLSVDGMAGTGTLTLIYEQAAGKSGSSSGNAQTGSQTGSQTTASQTTASSQAGLFSSYATVRYGDSGSRVRELQKALGQAGYACGSDGKYGSNTRKAVENFQRAQGLKADGVAGKATLKKLESALNASTTAAAAAVSVTVDNTDSSVRQLQQKLKNLGYYSGSVDGVTGDQTTAAVRAFQNAMGLSADGVAGDQTLSALNQAASTSTLRSGSSGSAVTQLQKRLKALGYSVSVTGTYDSETRNAVKQFQKRSGLSQDGTAGKKTLTRLYSASAAAAGSGSSESVQTSGSSAGSPVTSVNAPSVGQVRLLHWFNDIKPTLRSGQNILVVDPKTGISWTLKLYSLGRHADAEPATSTDTQQMIKAFGGVKTWNQKAVYVRLPSGTWTVASTHDMPHMSGSVKENDFNGHLCVHFLRDMEEAKKNDPNYGVANQEAIRAFWKSLTGESISN